MRVCVLIAHWGGGARAAIMRIFVAELLGVRDGGNTDGRSAGTQRDALLYNASAEVVVA